MDIDDLRIVTAVARHGSMNRAAADLHMVQSSVTARIRSMEDELGVKLFVRHSRGVRLSEAGARLLSYSDRIHSLLLEAIASVKEDGIPKGHLSIGTTEPTASMRLPRIVSGFAGAYPAVALTITTGNSADLIEQVVDRQLDGAFVAAPVQHPALVCEPLFQENLIIASHASVHDLDALSAHNDVKAIVLDQGCSYRDLLSGALNARGIAHQLLPLASFEAIQTCVQSGIGVTLLPAELYRNRWQDASTHAHHLPEFAKPIDTLFIRRQDRQQHSALNAFVAASRTTAALPHTA